MALIDRASTASVDTSSAIVSAPLCGDLFAAVDLDAVAPCYVGADGKVRMSIGTAANIAAHVDGFTPKKYRAGQSVDLMPPGVRFGYGSGLTPGTDLYLGGTAGRLDTAATTGGTKVIARVVSATDIVFTAYA